MSTEKSYSVVSVLVKPYIYNWLRAKYGVNARGEIVVNDKREPGGIMLAVHQNSIRKRTYYNIYMPPGCRNFDGYKTLYIRYIPKNECEVPMFDERGIYFFNRSFDIRFKEMMMMYIYANIENGSNSIKSSLLKFLLINNLGEDDVNFDSLMRYIMRRMDKEIDTLPERARFLLGLRRKPSPKRPFQQTAKARNKGVLLLNLIFDKQCQDIQART